MKEIKYIVFYDYDKIHENRVSAVSTITKSNYIMDKLCENNYVNVISPGWTNNKKFYKKKKIMIENNIELTLFNTIPWISFFKVISIFYSKLQLLIYILFNIKKTDTVIIYHSMYLINIISICKKIKKFRLIIEVEEIYSDVLNSVKKRKKEIKYLQKADAYLLSTKLLNKEVNKYNKPYILSHGTYKVEHSLSYNKHNKCDERKIVHCVYAGTLDPRKGGALAAIESAKYLSKNYHIHILGFGSNQQVLYIKKLIEDISKIANSKITYDGLLTGESYIKFIQNCDIGLSTQNPDAAFNATSFPSKILSYMTNGLRVVSIRIPAIETSDVGKYIYYYDKQTPQNIANAIMSVDMNDSYDGKLIIKKLDKKFQKDLEMLINE